MTAEQAVVFAIRNSSSAKEFIEKLSLNNFALVPTNPDSQEFKDMVERGAKEQYERNVRMFFTPEWNDETEYVRNDYRERARVSLLAAIKPE